METTVLNQEQKNFFIEKTWQDSKEFCEAVVSSDTDNVLKYINGKIIGWGLGTAEAIFIIRYGNIQMKTAYTKTFVPSDEVMQYILEFEKDTKFATHALRQYLGANVKLPIQMFEKCMVTCNFAEIIPILLPHHFENNDWKQIPDILQKRGNTLELALFYAYNPKLAPNDFWNKPSLVQAVLNHPKMFYNVSEETLLHLLAHTKIGRAFFKAPIWSSFNADMAIVMYTKGAYSLEEITAHAKGILFINKELEKLYDCDVNLFKAIMAVMQFSGNELFAQPIRNEVLEPIINKHFDSIAVQINGPRIINHSQAKLFLTIIFQKELWDSDLIRRIIYKPYNEFVLLWLQKLNAANTTLDIYENSIIKNCNYECIEYMLDKFGLQDVGNEKCFASIKLRATRERIIQFYHDTYGFRSDEGKKLWKEYQKEHAPKLSVWQKIKNLFG